MNRNKFTNRRIFFYLLILSSSLILLFKLFFLQIIDNSYKLSAEKNVVKQEIIYPKRGYIYDRNKIVLAGNQRAYDLMVIPREIGNIDTLKFCQIIDLKIENFEKKIQKSKNILPLRKWKGHVMHTKTTAVKVLVLMKKNQKDIIKE